MYKIASVALAVALGVAGMAKSVPAEAHPTISVGVDFPDVAIVGPYAYGPAYYSPYYYAHDRYWRRDYDRDRDYRFRRRWDGDGDRRWNRR